MAVKFRIAIIEPSQILRAGLETSLSQISGKFQILWSFSSLSHYSSFADEIDPDIIIVNPALFDPSGAETVKSILSSTEDTRIIAFSYTHTSDILIRQFDSVISIYDTPAEIALKIEKTAGSVSSDSDKKYQKQSGHPESYDLSDRELEVLVSVAKGCTNKEIAGIHNISVHTVISHRKNIVRKTGIKSVSGLTVYALLNGLIEQ